MQARDIQVRAEPNLSRFWYCVMAVAYLPQFTPLLFFLLNSTLFLARRAKVAEGALRSIAAAFCVHERARLATSEQVSGRTNSRELWGAELCWWARICQRED